MRMARIPFCDVGRRPDRVVRLDPATLQAAAGGGADACVRLLDALRHLCGRAAPDLSQRRTPGDAGRGSGGLGAPPRSARCAAPRTTGRRPAAARSHRAPASAAGPRSAGCGPSPGRACTCRRRCRCTRPRCRRPCRCRCRTAPGPSGRAVGPRWVTPWWFSKPVSGGRPSCSSMSPSTSPTHRSPSPRVLTTSSSPRPGSALPEVVDELVAEDLVAGAHREDDRAVGHRPVQPAVPAQPLGRQPLRPVLAAADQIDVAGGGDLLVGADVQPGDVQPALPRPALHHQRVALVAVGAQQVGVDPHQTQAVLTHATHLRVALVRGSVADAAAQVLERGVVGDGLDPAGRARSAPPRPASAQTWKSSPATSRRTARSSLRSPITQIGCPASRV